MQKAKKVGLGQNTLKSRLFYASLVIIPSLQFLIFWVFVNFNSILLAFKVFDESAASMSDFDWGLGNFKHWFTSASIKGMKYDYKDVLPALGVTMKSYVISLVVSLPLGLFFSYYMFKKMPGSKLFRVLLFMPSILSAAPLAVIFLNMSTSFLGGPNGWFPALDFDKNKFFSMTFFGLFIGFGTSVLMYTNKMDSIAPEIIESAHLDGANGIKEFWYIVLPQTFSIVQVFLITGFAGAFSNQGNVFILFNYSSPKEVTSLGFLLWNGIRDAGVSMNKMAPYAALGLIITLIVVPLTFLFRWLIEKYGWHED